MCQGHRIFNQVFGFNCRASSLGVGILFLQLSVSFAFLLHQGTDHFGVIFRSMRLLPDIVLSFTVRKGLMGGWSTLRQALEGVLTWIWSD